MQVFLFFFLNLAHRKLSWIINFNAGSRIMVSIILKTTKASLGFFSLPWFDSLLLRHNHACPVKAVLLTAEAPLKVVLSSSSHRLLCTYYVRAKSHFGKARLDLILYTMQTTGGWSWTQS